MHFVKQRGNTFFRMFFTFLLLSVVVVSIASATAYSMFNRIYQHQITSSLEKSIQYEVERLDADVFSRAATLIQDLSINESYAETFYEIVKNDSVNSVAISRAYNQLASIGRIYNNMISSVIIYYPQKDLLLSSNMGYKQLEAPYNEQYRKFVSILPDASGLFLQWDVLHTTQSLPGLQNGSVLLFSTAQWQGITSHKNAMIVVALKNSFIEEKLKYIASSEGSAYLLSESGEIIASGGKKLLYSPIRKEETKKSLLSGELTSLKSEDGMLHICAPMGSMNFYLLYSSPIDSFQEASSEVARIMLIVVTGALLASFVLTFLFSQRLYSPIRNLMNVVKNIQPVSSKDEYGAIRTAIDTLSANLSNAQRLQQINRPVIRNTLIHDLLRGLLSPGDSMTEALATAEISLPHEKFAVMIAEWSEKDLSLLPPNERSTVQFALREQMEEFSEGSARIYTYLPSRMRIVLLINAPEESQALIEDAAGRIKTLLSALNVRSMCAFGGWTGQLSGLSRAYQQAQLEMEFRIMCPEDTLIIPSDQSPGALNTSADEEERFLKCIRESRREDACASILSLARMWRGMPPLSGYRSLLRISSALQEMSAKRKLASEESEIPRIIADAKSAVWSLSEYTEAMQLWLESVIEPAGSSGASRNELLLEKIIAYINEHIDEELSLESLSGEMHFNPKYFSRLFKELAGVTLSDYITKKRLKLAGEMLLQNKLTVEEISRKSGYGNSQYFARRFKEEFGVSPREYRIRGWKPEEEEQKNNEPEE